jgi:hypothetical protein
MVNIDAHKKYFLEIEELQQLSMGLYTTREIMTNYAREKFMVVIAMEVPECVDGLKLILRENLSLIKALLNKTNHRYPATIEEIIVYEEGEELFKLIYKWGYYWSITEKWMMENALIAICSWFNHIDLIDQIYWYNHPQKKDQALNRANEQRIKMEKDPEFPTHPGKYCPFIDKSRKDYHEELLSFMDQVEPFYEKYGFIKAITKKGDPQNHFRWLVQYQLLKWNTDKIVEDYIYRHPDKENITIDPVKKEIRKVAALIGLKIR